MMRAKHKIPLHAALPIAGLCAIGGAFSCGAAREFVGSSAEALEAGAPSIATFKGAEVSADWSIAAGSEVLVTAFNSQTTNIMGWSWTTDRGATWHPCDMNDPSGCNSFGAFTSFPPSTPEPNSFEGDPTVVTDRAGRAVYIALVDDGTTPTGKGGIRVLMVVSPDGGQNFDPSTAVYANDDGTSCSDGFQDQPNAAFDFTTSPPTLWVTWRNNNRGNSLPPGTYGGCIRRFFINSAGQLQALDVSHDMGLTGSVEFWGVGGIRVAAGDGAVTAVYSSTDSVSRCTTSSTSALSIRATTSYDQGATWTNYTDMAGGQYLGCVLDEQVDIGANPRNFDVARSVDGTLYVVAQDTSSTVRLYESRLNSVHVDGWDNSAGGPSFWSEWCPDTSTGLPFDDAATPTMNWTAPGNACATPFYQQPNGASLAMPNIGTDDLGALGVSFYEADDSDAPDGGSLDQRFHVRFLSNTQPRSASSSFSDVAVTPDFTPGIGGGAGAFRALGDYEGMAVRNTTRSPQCSSGDFGTFIPVWTFSDTGDAGTDAMAAGQSIQAAEVSLP